MTNEDYTCCRHQIDYYSALALLCYPKSRKKVRIVCRVALSIFLFFVKKKREQAIRLLSAKVVGRGIRRSFLFKILNCPTSVQHSRSQELSNVFNELHWKGFRFLPFFFFLSVPYVRVSYLLPPEFQRLPSERRHIIPVSDSVRRLPIPVPASSL